MRHKMIGYPNHKVALGGTALVVLGLSACASLSPQQRDAYDQAHAQVQQLASEPLANQAAGTQLQQARAYLSNDDSAAREHQGDDVMYWSYMAAHEAQIGEAMVAELQSREQIASAAAARDRTLLDYQRQRAALAADAAARAEERAREAEQQLDQLRQEQQQQQVAQAQEQAGQQIAQAQQAAQQAQQQAELAKQQADQATQQADASQQAQQQAQQQADQAQQQIVAAEQQAEQAQQQAQLANAQTQDAKEQARQAKEQAEQIRQQLVALQARNGADTSILTLSGSVLFTTGRSVLEPGATEALDNIAVYLQRHPNINVRVEGFADSTGSETSNDALSQRRAQAVAEVLEHDGVPTSRIETVGRGATMPVASNGDSAGRQQNRRVELFLSNDRGQFATAQGDHPELR